MQTSTCEGMKDGDGVIVGPVRMEVMAGREQQAPRHQPVSFYLFLNTTKQYIVARQSHSLRKATCPERQQHRSSRHREAGGELTTATMRAARARAKSNPAVRPTRKLLMLADSDEPEKAVMIKELNVSRRRGESEGL
eukprot:750587-Hanusia_phi.AAC.2